MQTYTQQFFNEAKSDNLTIMTFRKADGFTLLRVHKPDFYGDYASDKRHILNAVNKEERSHNGFEVGKLDALFRIVHPIFNHDGNYIGNLEIGFKPESFLEPINSFLDISIELLIYKKYSDVLINRKT